MDETRLAELDLTERERAELLAHVLRLEPDDVSASELRRRLRENEPTDDLLHPAVARRIHDLELYGASP